MIAIAGLRSPVPADLNIRTVLLFLRAGLLRLLWRALWLHRSLWLAAFGLALSRRVCLLLGDGGH